MGKPGNHLLFCPFQRLLLFFRNGRVATIRPYNPLIFGEQQPYAYLNPPDVVVIVIPVVAGNVYSGIGVLRVLYVGVPAPLGNDDDVGDKQVVATATYLRVVVRPDKGLRR